MQRLARALGASPNLIRKPLAFVRRFTEPADLEELERLRVPWTAVVMSMSLGNREEQLALLRESVRQGWPASRLEMEVRRRLGERRQPRTGRPPRPPAADAPEVELQELLGRVESLSRYLGVRWLQGEGSLLASLRQRSRRQMPPALRRLVQHAEEALAAATGQIDRLQTGLHEVGSDGSGADRT